jgi:3-hydroxymyristoyl/3-hydroxydecanoyl-(acyl carrier protein) dehydratase
MDTVATFTISAEHPAFNGHFPGAPLLPGVVLLDEALRRVELASSAAPGSWQVASAKFSKPVRPGETLTLEHARLPNGSIRFAIRSAGRSVASGTLIPSPKPNEPYRGHHAG